MSARRSVAARLRASGTECQACRTRKGRLDLGDVLARLGARRMTNLLVEGGGTVHSAFLTEGLADEAAVFVAPRIIGGGPSEVNWPTGSVTSYELPGPTRIGQDQLWRVAVGSRRSGR